MSGRVGNQNLTCSNLTRLLMLQLKLRKVAPFLSPGSTFEILPRRLNSDLTDGLHLLKSGPRWVAEAIPAAANAEERSTCCKWPKNDATMRMFQTASLAIFLALFKMFLAAQVISQLAENAIAKPTVAVGKAGKYIADEMFYCCFIRQAEIDLQINHRKKDNTARKSAEATQTSTREGNSALIIFRKLQTGTSRCRNGFVLKA
ncbi:hypothetical protein AXG93_3719s1500 [Marchantia polymorpha subsp. ruderalis]|uniref:Uncharacterized protein n=1 Tax=Marchantia polymorpha subsp. ruderalis TaxID=1480154 RepID=A0A176VMH4_MARPO|nr:hypothetical protein AXG93_3719s1500 [Marchantia polymorpha subsp. ruderalis]